MKYFSMFSGIGYGILETWIGKNTNANIRQSGKPKTESMYCLWRGQGTTLKHQNKRLQKLSRIKNTARESGLKHCNTTVASVLVVARRLQSFYASTILRTMGQNIGKRWSIGQLHLGSKGIIIQVASRCYATIATYLRACTATAHIGRRSIREVF